jgi:hypothetical protein
MSTSTYRVRLTFGSFLFRADFSQAASSIEVNHDPDEDEDSWGPTPVQVADARHEPEQAARLLVEDCGPDYYARPDDGRDSDEILAEVMAAATVKRL